MRSVPLDHVSVDRAHARDTRLWLVRPSAGNTVDIGASVLLVNGSDTTISGSTFHRNNVAQFGGSLAVGAGSLTVEDSM